jgi:hypothetical protein
MEKQLLDEVIACLPEGRTLFHYHRDSYTLYLLERLCRRGQIRTLADLKQSPYARWLNKPLLKNAAAAFGHAQVPLQDLLDHAHARTETSPYVLTLGQWGSAQRSAWKQTSRPGFNLVLHLNLPLSHVRQLQALGLRDFTDIIGTGHPHDRRRITLAWARIDLDFTTGEALIEEIQSDWTRDVIRLFKQARMALDSKQKYVIWWNGDLCAKRLLMYEKTLESQCRQWSEAMLTAALWFLLDELGMREVFYHSWKTGIAAKRMSVACCPPRSLYSELPERFNFSPCNHGPAFLENTPSLARIRKKQKEWLWYHWAA